MLSAAERLEAISYGFKPEELKRYEELRGVALVEDLRSGVRKTYSHSFAKFLEDKGIVRIIGVGDTPQDLAKASEESSIRTIRRRPTGQISYRPGLAKRRGKILV